MYLSGLWPTRKAGRASTPFSGHTFYMVVPLPDPEGLSDEEIAAYVQALQAELFERAVRSADPDALVTLGFKEGFRADGLPREPFFSSGVLICPGARVDKSGTSHECGFVRIDNAWVWESDLKFADVVKNMAERRVQMRSVSLVAAQENTAVDLIYSSARSGIHRLKQARSYVVTNGALTLVETRSLPSGGPHR